MKPMWTRRPNPMRPAAWPWLGLLALAAAAPLAAQTTTRDDRPGVVRCAMVIYGTEGKAARCFAPHFMKDVQAKTRIWTAGRFDAVRLDDPGLFI